jgi:8-amino-7-oxononanoate synthase
MTNRLAARIAARLESLGAASLLRTLTPPAGVDLSSNDYLDLARDPRLVAAFTEGAAREGCGSTGSRLLRGDRMAFHDVERRFADFKGTEAALYFSSGYLANLALLSTVPEAGDLILSDDRNHASVIDGVRLARAERTVFPHNDVAAVESHLRRRDLTAGHAFVVVESVFSMEGDLAPLADYATVCDACGATLVVDEAHAVGLFGARGSGRIEAAGIAADRCISVNSAGKALGVSGAFVAGPRWAIDYLVQRARPFVFSTAAPPAVADAIGRSLEIVESEPDRRARVLARSQHARMRLAAAGLDVPEDPSPIVPILIGDNAQAVAVASALQLEGFDIRAIRPPTVPEGSARLRLSVHASLEEATIDRFVDVLSHALRGVVAWPAAFS